MWLGEAPYRDCMLTGVTLGSLQQRGHGQQAGATAEQANSDANLRQSPAAGCELVLLRYPCTEDILHRHQGSLKTTGSAFTNLAAVLQGSQKAC